MIKRLATVLEKTGITVTEPVIQRIGPYTIVEMKDSKEHTAYGLSRCSYLDQDRTETGLVIARGRAEKALLKKLNHEKIQHPFMA